MAGSMEFNFAIRPTGSGPAGRGAAQAQPMRILLIGNFSGRQGVAAAASLATRPTLRVDVDTLPELMRRLAPSVPVGATAFEAQDIDDFHPDSLFARVPELASLRELRRRLQDPAQFAQAAAELGMNSAKADSRAGAVPAAAAGDLLAGLLGGRPGGAARHTGTPAAAQAAPAGIDAFIRQIVAPHVVPDHGAQQAALLASVDLAIAEQMRQLLHAPEFQAIESAWRGLHLLQSQLELDEQLQLHLFDVSREELLADLVAAQGDVPRTGLFRVLVERNHGAPDAQAWSLLVGLFSFGPSDTDIGLLAALGVLASKAGGPFLAAADMELALAEPAALTGWQRLRRSAELAPWIGLSAPRLLLRAPYGRRSDPITAFAFEELPAGEPEHEHLLWGPSSVATALLIARAFRQKGWSFEPGDESELGELPSFTYERDGERELQACAETYLSERAAQVILDAGLMPLLSHRNRHAVTVMRFQSIAEPAGGLAGLDSDLTPV